MFGLNEGDVQIFSIKLHGEYRKAEIDIHLQHGDVEVWVSDILGEFSNSKTLSNSGKLNFIFED